MFIVLYLLVYTLIYINLVFSPRPQLYRCNLHWQDPVTLLIGWADNIKVQIAIHETDPKYVLLMVLLLFKLLHKAWIALSMG